MIKTHKRLVRLLCLLLVVALMPPRSQLRIGPVWRRFSYRRSFPPRLLPMYRLTPGTIPMCGCNMLWGSWPGREMMAFLPMARFPHPGSDCGRADL